MSRQRQKKAKNLAVKLAASASAKTAAKFTLGKTGWACTCSATENHWWPCPKKQTTRPWKVTARYFALPWFIWWFRFIFQHSNITIFPHHRRREKDHPPKILKVKKEKTAAKQHFRVPFAIKSFPEQCGWWYTCRSTQGRNRTPIDSVKNSFTVSQQDPECQIQTNRR